MMLPLRRTTNIEEKLVKRMIEWLNLNKKKAVERKALAQERLSENKREMVKKIYEKFSKKTISSSKQFDDMI